MNRLPDTLPCWQIVANTLSDADYNILYQYRKMCHPVAAHKVHWKSVLFAAAMLYAPRYWLRFLRHKGHESENIKPRRLIHWAALNICEPGNRPKLIELARYLGYKHHTIVRYSSLWIIDHLTGTQLDVVRYRVEKLLAPLNINEVKWQRPSIPQDAGVDGDPVSRTSRLILYDDDEELTLS